MAANTKDSAHMAGDREFFCELAPEEYFILINADSPDKAEQRTSDMAERLQWKLAIMTAGML